MRQKRWNLFVLLTSSKETVNFLIDFEQPTIKYIFSTGVVIPGNICGMLLQGQNCGLSDPEPLEWAIAPGSNPKPPVNAPSLPPV